MDLHITLGSIYSEMTSLNSNFDKIITCNSGASRTLNGIFEIFLDAFLGDLKSLTDLAEMGVKL